MLEPWDTRGSQGRLIQPYGSIRCFKLRSISRFPSSGGQVSQSARDRPVDLERSIHLYLDQCAQKTPTESEQFLAKDGSLLFEETVNHAREFLHG
ncbi:hypothetical protein [Caldalkalibacillus thermarum]|uniref:hypothetical protein n=1 Tax=Caldalkalibacillus thermarum TaxID=296745 RepID=UPI003B42C250